MQGSRLRGSGVPGLKALFGLGCGGFRVQG